MHRSSSQGFSLPEMAAAFSIMAILILIGAFAWFAIRDTGDETIAQNAVTQVAYQQGVRYRDRGSFTHSKADLQQMDGSYVYVVPALPTIDPDDPAASQESRAPREVSVLARGWLWGGDQVDTVAVAAAGIYEPGSGDSSPWGICYAAVVPAPRSGHASLYITWEIGDEAPCSASEAFDQYGASDLTYWGPGAG